MLVISNRPRASRSADFEITRPITPWIVLHSVQLLLLISNNLDKKGRKVSIKTRSPPASFSFKGQATKHATVKWCICLIVQELVHVVKWFRVKHFWFQIKFLPAKEQNKLFFYTKCLWSEVFCYPIRKSFKKNEEWRLFHCDCTLGYRVIQDFDLCKLDDLWRHIVDTKWCKITKNWISLTAFSL